MNVTFLNIVKRIIMDNGEAVLADPRRLKVFFGDLARDEPKPLRAAFGRCIEEGAYNALKTAPDAAERTERKAAIARRVRDEYGLDPVLCAEALDILEAALYGAQPAPPPVSPPRPQYTPSPPQQPRPSYQQAAPHAAPAVPKRSLRNVLIGTAVLIAVIALIALTVPGARISISPWRGYPTFESFSRAANIDVTEEEFKTWMSLAAFAYYLSSDKLAETLKIANALSNKEVKIDNIDIVGEKELSEQYGVSEAIRRDNNYLLKRNSMKGASQFAYFNGDTWVVLGVSAKQK
jgi:hypothetical protein